MQDAPADPVQMFTPANVLGGAFKYQGTSLKARRTVALVTWNDPPTGTARRSSTSRMTPPSPATA